MSAASGRRLQVLQLSHDYEGPFRALCRQYVQAFADADVTTVFLCGAASDDVAREVGGREVIFLERPRRAMRGLKLSTLVLLHRLLRDRSIDLVVAQRYRPVYFTGILSRFLDIPEILAVTHEHGVYRARARKRVIWYGKNISLIGVSEAVSDDLERAVPGLRESGRLYTLPNSIDAEIAGLLDRSAARAQLGLPDTGLVFGTIGRLIDKKEHHVLLDGFAGYCERGGEGDLVIVGDGPLAQPLRQQAARLGVDRRVHFAGRVDQAARLLCAFDAFVFASGEREAFGVVLLEAMCARLPVVCSRAAGPAEVVGNTALGFAPGNANELADRLLEIGEMSDEARKAMGDAGRSRFERVFSVGEFRRRLLDLPPVRRAIEAL